MQYVATIDVFISIHTHVLQHSSAALTRCWCVKQKTFADTPKTYDFASATPEAADTESHAPRVATCQDTNVTTLKQNRPGLILLHYQYRLLTLMSAECKSCSCSVNFN